MLLFFIRHGDPIYDPDKLTPLGQRQAEAVGKRLARYGLDEIYVSSSTRAIETSIPTREMLKMDATILDWTNESHAWAQLSLPTEDGHRTWCFMRPDIRELFTTKEIRALGEKWYSHPDLQDTKIPEGLRITQGNFSPPRVTSGMKRRVVIRTRNQTTSGLRFLPTTASG